MMVIQPEADTDLGEAVIFERERLSDYIDAERIFTEAKIAEFKRNGWPTPTNEMVKGWARDALSRRLEATNRIQDERSQIQIREVE